MRKQQKHKVIILTIFALCLAGLSRYWAHKNSANRASEDRSKSNARFSHQEPPEIDNPLPYRAVPAVYSPPQHETDSGRSRSFAELAQEIRIQSSNVEESDLFLPIANLATGHPDAQVREQGIAYLAESEDERAVVFLITGLLDPEFHIRQLSLNALYRSGKRVPVQPLIEVALNDAGAMRAQCLALIRQIAGAGSDEVLRLEARLQEVSDEF